MDRRKPRLVLRAHSHHRGGLRALHRGIECRQYPHGPGSFATQVQHLFVGIYALCRGYRRRSYVLRRRGACHHVHGPTRRRTRDYGSRKGSGGVGNVPLRHHRLGSLRAHGHGLRLLRLSPQHAVGHPLRVVPAHRKARAWSRRRCRRRRGHAGNRLRCHRVPGHRRCPVVLRLPPHPGCRAGTRAAVRADYHRGRNRHTLRGLRRG